jgi:hypothetical protein
MKRVVLILILILSIGIFVKADLFGIQWGSSDGEIGVGGAIPGIGYDVPIEEEEEEEEEGGGGGGGTVTPTVGEGFEINQTLIVVKATKGIPTQEKVTIMNIGRTNLTFNVSIESVDKYVYPAETTFTLKSGEVKNLILNVYVSESEKSNFTVGKINVQSKNITKSADIILDMRDKTALFDIRTTLLKKALIQGQRAFADILVLNFGDLKNIDVALELSLIDSERNIYDIKKEMFAINDSYEGEFFLTLPKNIDLGKYLFHAKVAYGNVTAESYDTLEVIESVINFAVLILYLIVAIVLIMITLVTIILRNKFKPIE